MTPDIKTIKARHDDCDADWCAHREPGGLRRVECDTVVLLAEIERLRASVGDHRTRCHDYDPDATIAHLQAGWTLAIEDRDEARAELVALAAYDEARK
jgi:hypothetical protein